MSQDRESEQLARSLTDAEEALAYRPEDHWRAPSRFGAAGKLARRLAWRRARAAELAARAAQRARMEELRRRRAQLEASTAPGHRRAPLDFADPFSSSGTVEVETDVGTIWMPESDILVRPTLQEHGLLGGAMTELIHELEPGMTFVDVGANVGYYALMAARAVGPTGRVICVEPNPENLVFLRANLWRHGLLGARVLPVAAWSERDHLPMVIYPAGGGAASEIQGSEPAETLVPCARLDELIDGPVDLLKVDAERSDHYVIRGSTGTIAENPGLRIIAEFCPGALDHKGEDSAAIIQEWAALGALSLVGYEIQPATPEEILAVGGVLDVMIETEPSSAASAATNGSPRTEPRGLRKLAEPWAERRRAFDAAADATEELIGRALARRRTGIELATTLGTEEVTAAETAVGPMLAPPGESPSPPEGSGPLERFLTDELGPGMTFVDASAGLGYWSILAARLVGPEGLVLALEPDPDRRPILCANLWRHAWRCARVEVALLAADSRHAAAPGSTALLPAAPLDRLLGSASADVVRIGPGLDPYSSLEGVVTGPVASGPTAVIVEPGHADPTAITRYADALGLRSGDREDGLIVLRRG